MLNKEAEIYTDRVIQNNFQPYEHIVKNYKIAFKKLFRIACFTENALHMQMWAHYAKYFDENKIIDRGGLCIGYRIDEGFKNLNLYSITYNDEIPIVTVEEDIEDFTPALCYRKESLWSYEKEWRISSIIQAKLPFPKNLTTNSKVKVQNSVDSIIFGDKTPNTIIKKISEEVQSKKSDIKLFCVVKNFKTQKLELSAI